MSHEAATTEEVLAEVKEAVAGGEAPVKKVRTAKHDPEGGQMIEKPAKKERKPKEPKQYPQFNEDGTPQLNEDGSPVMGTTKPPKAPKPKKEPALDENGNPIRRSAFDKAATITLVQVENPKRAGSAAHGRYALYQDGMTVEEALAAGVTSGDLQYDTAKGFITIDLKIGTVAEQE
jgi:hypothetical protein